MFCSVLIILLSTGGWNDILVASDGGHARGGGGMNPLVQRVIVLYSVSK